MKVSTNLIFFFLLLSTIMVCRPEKRNTQKKTSKVEENFYYSRYLIELNLHKEPDTNSKIIYEIPSSEKLLSLKETKETVHAIWKKVKVANKIGWVQQRYLMDAKPYSKHNINPNLRFDKELYFRVVTKSGLYLRNRPDIKSRILGIARYRSTGRVYTEDTTMHKIQKRKGYWFLTKLGKRIGWMFSGFVVIGSKKNIVSGNFDIRKNHAKFMFKVLRPSKDKKISFLKKPVGVTKKQLGKRTIHTVRYYKKDVCIKVNSEIIITDNQTGQIYYLSRVLDQHIHEKVVETNAEKGYFLTEVTLCLCCCGNEDYGKILFQDSNILYNYSSQYPPQKFPVAYKGRCFEPNLSFPYHDIRYDLENHRIDIFLKESICETDSQAYASNGEYDPHGKTPRVYGDELLITHENMNSNDFSTKKLFNKQIPEDIRKVFVKE
ncbi:MAG: SH3 domain-containing protein [Spirochaetota bacterium]